MKRSFDLAIMLKNIEKAVSGYPKAAMFELYERGYTSLFEQLVACVISIRTLDETTIPLSEKLFALARTPEQLLQLSAADLEKLLYGCTYPEQKAYTILNVARAAVQQYKGVLPADFTKLTALERYRT